MPLPPCMINSCDRVEPLAFQKIPTNQNKTKQNTDDKEKRNEITMTSLRWVISPYDHPFLSPTGQQTDITNTGPSFLHQTSKPYLKERKRKEKSVIIQQNTLSLLHLPSQPQTRPRRDHDPNSPSS